MNKTVQLPRYIQRSVDAMTHFIFMLTKNDLTVGNALEIFEDVRDTGLRHVGFKDIGLPIEKLKVLVQEMKDEGMKTYLEVVSESEAANLKSVKTALDLGVNFLIGGTFIEQSLKLLPTYSNRPAYYPYVGRVIGHPCLLRGTIDEIVADGKRKEAMGIDGINLLAYRFDGNVELLIQQLHGAVKVPIIVAGSIDSYEKIQRMIDLKVDAFTIGGAIMDRNFVLGRSIREQVSAVLRKTGEAS